MTTLLLSARHTEDDQLLWRAAIRRGWSVERVRGIRVPEIHDEDVVVYVEALYGPTIASALGLRLLEPEEGWLTKLPYEFRKRDVTLSTLGKARHLAEPSFVKPPNDKSFEAKVYSSGAELPEDFDDSVPVLVGEPVQWDVEFRCFILDRTVQTLSPYVCNGRHAKLDDYSASTEEKNDVQVFVQSMLQRFSVDELACAGILLPGEDGEKRLSPVVDGGQQAVILRNADGDIVDIVNMCGALASHDPPAFSSCLDHNSVIWSGESKGILVAFGEDDLAVLRMLELACTPAAGMEKISGRQARRLLDDLEVERCQQEDMAPIAAGEFRLVLVGWRPARLAVQCPEALPVVGSRLLNAETLLGLDCSPMVSVWFPTGDELARIRAAYEFREAPLVREQMWKSISRSSYSVREFYKITTPKSPTGYAFAQRIAGSAQTWKTDHGLAGFSEGQAE